MRKLALFVALATLSLIPSVVPASAGMECPRDYRGYRVPVGGCGYNNNGYYGGGYARPAPSYYAPAPVYVERNGPSGLEMLGMAVIGAAIGAVAVDSYNNMQQNQQAPQPPQTAPAQ